MNPHVAFDTGNPFPLLMTLKLRNQASNSIGRNWKQFYLFVRRRNGTTAKFSGDYLPLLPQERSILEDGQHLCLLGLHFLETFGIGFVSDGNRSWLIPRTLLHSFRSQMDEEVDGAGDQLVAKK